MPLLFGCLSLIFPRVALLLVWLLGGGYLARAYQHWILPVIGFFVLPLTTLVFAYVHNSLGPPGQVTTIEWAFVALAALVDLGMLRGGGGHAQRWRRERW
jgi:hypothetical protein